MTTENKSMTIHRALAELKLIDSKIDKGIDGIKAMAIYKDNGTNVTDRDNFNKQAVADLDSIKSLTERRFLIKKSIVSSNAVTIVKVGEKEMTVAEAITMKSFIQTQERLIAKLTQELKSGRYTVEKENAQMEQNLLKMLEVSLGKDNVKSSGEDVKSISDAYRKSNQYSLLDPLKLEEEIQKLTAAYEDFTANVDAALSESNAVTVISI